MDKQESSINNSKAMPLKSVSTEILKVCIANMYLKSFRYAFIDAVIFGDQLTSGIYMYMYILIYSLKFYNVQYRLFIGKIDKFILIIILRVCS